MNTLDAYTKKQYLNLETYRRNGDCVRTPVWFCQMGESLYVMTGPASGKVKRIHRDGKVKIAPCTMNGKPTGDWSLAVAREVTDAELVQKVDHLMDKKYGLQKKLFRLSTSSAENPASVLEIQLLGAA